LKRYAGGRETLKFLNGIVFEGVVHHDDDDDGVMDEDEGPMNDLREAMDAEIEAEDAPMGID
jgi:hypothetical protein